jgi:hypothetical protein
LIESTAADGIIGVASSCRATTCAPDGELGGGARICAAYGLEVDAQRAPDCPTIGAGFGFHTVAQALG